jgi:hypothetical protein
MCAVIAGPLPAARRARLPSRRVCAMDMSATSAVAPPDLAATSSASRAPTSQHAAAAAASFAGAACGAPPAAAAAASAAPASGRVHASEVALLVDHYLQMHFPAITPLFRLEAKPLLAQVTSVSQAPPLSPLAHAVTVRPAPHFLPPFKLSLASWCVCLCVVRVGVAWRAARSRRGA